MTYSPQFLDELRQRAPLVEIIGRRVNLIRRGREHVALCPFHKEKTPSFTVNEAKRFWRCFGCGAHGDVIGWMMRIDNLEFLEAVKRLAADVGLDDDPGGAREATQRDTRDGRTTRASEPAVPRKPTLRTGGMTERAEQWFAGRGISRATLDANKITVTRVWMPGADGEVWCIAFPFFRAGEIINVKYRDSSKRFRQEKGCEKVFYGLDTCPNRETVIIVEGEIDWLSLYEAGLAESYGLLSVPDGAQMRQAGPDAPIDPENDGGFAYVWNCRDVIERAKRVILAVDDDAPGRALEEELARRIGKEKCWRVRWPASNDVQCKDANEVLVDHGAEAVRECIKAARPYPIRSLFEAGRFESATLRLFREGRERGMSSGFAALDGLLSIVPGLLYVVTGYPSSGKSEVVDAIAMNLAMMHDQRFALCSFENTPEDHLAKLAEKYLAMPFWHSMGATRMGEGDLRQALAWINDRFFFIRADDESPTIDWVLEKARAAVLHYGINGLVLDPYNEFEHKRPRGMSETDYVSELLSKVKRFAAAHGVHVWFVAHPAKPEKMDELNNAPSLMAISGSAHWVNKCDFGISVHRKLEADGKRSRISQVHVKKVRFRHLGEPGIAELRFNPATGRYEDSAYG